MSIIDPFLAHNSMQLPKISCITSFLKRRHISINSSACFLEDADTQHGRARQLTVSAASDAIISTSETPSKEKEGP